MGDSLWLTVWLTVKIAVVAVTALALPGLWLAWRLARWRGARRMFADTLLALPLALPPTVVGYALLLLLGRGTAFGRWLNDFAHLRLLFTWPGASLAASAMALPLLVRAAAAAFASVDPELLEVGRTLGASERVLLWRIVLPLAKRGVVAGLGLAFARALGEFGATLMVAGNIPGETRTLSLALYDAVQSGNDNQALTLAALLAALTLAITIALTLWEKRSG